MDTKSISSIFSSLLSSARDDAQTIVEETRQLPEIQQAIKALADRNPDRFYLSLLYPLTQVVRGLVNEQVGRSQEADFLLMQREFVSSHIRKLIEQHEGWPCSADKVRTIMRVALTYYIDQKPIEFNYQGEYVFHLPTKIFNDQESILGFINGLKHLYYGDPEPYLQQLLHVKKRAAQAEQSQNL